MARSLLHALRHNAIALLALFVALGGTAFAATQLPKNSVGAKQLKANAVSSGKIKDGAITAKDVKKGSLTGAVFAGGAAGLKGDPGGPGPQGAQGPQGPQGLQGAAGSARAYAFVNPGACPGSPGICAFETGKGVTAVTRASTGFYCIAVPGLTPAQVPSLATVDYGYTAGPETATSAQTLTTGAGTCPNGASDFVVITQRLTAVAGPALTDSTADNIGFTFLVP